RIEWYINGFFGSDGLSLELDQSQSELAGDINNVINFTWHNFGTFGVSGLKILPVDKLFIHLLVGYEFLYLKSKRQNVEDGKKNYSAEFLLNNPGITESSFEVEDITSIFTRRNTIHSLQTRLDLDFTFNNYILVSMGSGIIYDFNEYGTGGNKYEIVKEGSNFIYKNIDYFSSDSNNRLLKSFGYLNMEITPLGEAMKISVGIRVDHTKIFGNFKFNTYPVPGPRFNFIFIPVKDTKVFDHIGFGVGVGIFSKSPDSMSKLNADYGIKDFDISVPRGLITVIGSELAFHRGFKFKIEGYYKYYHKRYYFNRDLTISDSEYMIHSDGIGHVGGFDLILQRRISRYIDGWISYSFVYARYKNPSTDDLVSKTNTSGEPTGQWYYPSFHRFHNISLVLNIKPLKWLTITQKVFYSTGVPKKVFGAPEMFAANLEDGTTLELYRRKSYYDDNG
ncbi:MAG: hypothetical protein KAS39_03045, partial [Actinomycetia bacterium]|nr:hypothetical protein [Actinomycetes bacterium]